VRVRWLVTLVLVAVCIFFFAREALDPRTQVLWQRPRGTITSGDFLGVRVGDNVRQATDALQDLGFEPPIRDEGAAQHFSDGVIRLDPTNYTDVVQVAPDELLLIFRDRSLARKGNVMLIIREERVVRVIWAYQGPFAP